MTLAEIRKAEEVPVDDNENGSRCELCGSFLSRAKKASSKRVERHFERERECPNVVTRVPRGR